jgi:hypothetical protein
MNTKHLLFGLACCAAFGSATTEVSGAFAPITLTADSYSQDGVVEVGATAPFLPATTASMDTGTNNTGGGWYERGYNLNSPGTGLPLAGETFTSESFGDHSYTMPPSYATNNALLLDLSRTNGTLTLSTPTVVTGLSFLLSSGNGESTLGYTVHHVDGSSETGTIVSRDWFNGDNPAVTASGRLTVNSGEFDSVDSNNPRLYSADVVVANASPVTSIDLSADLLSPTSHAAIFAVSGGTASGFTPLLVTGFNEDMVVEASAPQTGALNATSATMDDGTANTGNTWYEKGYHPRALNTGIPTAGSVLTNAPDADHSFRFAPSYSANNVLLVDADNGGSFTPATPSNFSALSFLTSAGGGSVVISYVINHSDGSSETGTFVSPDWFNNVPVAYTSRGRVNVETGGFDTINSDNPRIYAADISVANTSSPVTRVDLTYSAGTGHAMIFAMSGTAGAVKPIFDAQPASTNVFTGTNVLLSAMVSGTSPIQFQWQHGSGSVFLNVTNGGKYSGATSTNLAITEATVNEAGGYRLIASNTAGSSTSIVAQVNVLSTLLDVTSPSDEITAFGGQSPGAEPVANAIENTTSKYLNFGSPEGDTAPPFVGPVGLVVTPAAGSTIVKGIRFYTANDVEARDPADYTLEGSNDGGTNFTVIATGTLSLPSARNDSALDINPLTLANQEVLFANNAGYTTYRLTFNTVKDSVAANSMQIGEIELLGAAGSSGPTLTISRNADGTLRITSSAPGRLQSTTALVDGGPGTGWAEEGPIVTFRDVAPIGPMKFYRVVTP